MRGVGLLIGYSSTRPSGSKIELVRPSTQQLGGSFEGMPPRKIVKN